MTIDRITSNIQDTFNSTADLSRVLEGFRSWLFTFETRFWLTIALLIIFIAVNFVRICLKRHAVKLQHPSKSKKDTPPKHLPSKEHINKDLSWIERQFVKILLVKPTYIQKPTNPDGKIRFSHEIALSIKYFFKGFSLKSMFRLWRKKIVIFNLAILTLIIFFAVITFFIKPKILSTNPSEDSYMTSGDQHIELYFDLPFDTDTIEFNISPVVKGKWEIMKVNTKLPFSRKAVFYPEESIYPGNEVVIYVTGIRQWWQSGKLHEEATQFKAPVVPNITETTPAADSVDIAINSNIVLEFDSPIGDFINLDIQIKPEVEFESTIKDNHTVMVDFLKNLNQDQQYEVMVYRTARSYIVATGEDLEVGNTKEIKSFKFNTVTTPLVKSYTPKGDSILPNSDIVIEFDQPMDNDSVVEHLVISPELEGDLEWENELTAKYVPVEELKKATDYEIILSKGIQSVMSGATESDIILKFTTIGPVKVTSNTPLNGSSGLNPNTTNVVIEFNQEVDKSSAESSFSITPQVTGTFAWNGNTMTYTTAGKLGYSTRYDIKVKKGVKTVHGLDSAEDFNTHFTTMSNTFTLDVPWYNQQEGFTCNIAATRMVLAYRGKYVSEADVKAGVGIGTNPNSDWVDGYGVHVGPIAEYIGQYRNVSIKKGWNVAELAQEIEKGNPVIVWWYNRYSQPYGAFTLSSGATGYTGMHSEVARGFIGSSSNPSSILTNDPWRGRLTYNTTLFTSTWAYLGYTALVVY